MKRVLIGLLALITVAVGGVFAYASLVLLKPERVKPMVEAAVLESTGRTLKINGDLTPSIGLSPTIAVHNITLGNAEWGKAEQLLSAKELSLSFSLLPLLGGNFHITNVALDGATINLETKDGTPNWTFDVEELTDDDSGVEAEAELPKEDGKVTMDAISVTNSAFSFHDLTAKKQYALSIESLSANDIKGTEIGGAQLTARYEGMDISLTAALEAPLLMYELSATDKAVTLTAKGSLSLSDQVFDADVSLSASSLSALLAKAQIKNTTKTPLSVQANLGGTPKLISFSKLALTYDKLSAQGNGKLDLSQPKPKLTGALNIPSYDARSPKAAAPSGEPAAKASASDAPAGTMVPSTPLPLEGLAALNAELALSIGKLQLNQTTLTKGAAKLTLKNSKLTLSGIQMNAADGSLRGDVTLNARTQLPSYNLSFNSEKLTLGALLADLTGDTSLEGGKITAKLEMQGNGASPHAMLASANGHYGMLIEEASYTPPPETKVAGAFFDILRSPERVGQPVTVKCAIADFAIADGVATSQALALQSPAAIVTGDGNVNMAKETVRLSFKARSTVLSLADVVPPLIIAGSWKKPSVTLDAKANLLGIGKFALGAATGVGLIAVVGEKFTDKIGITSDNNPCMKSIEEAAEKAAQADANPKEAYKNSEDNIRAIRDGVKGDVKEEIKDVEQDVRTIRDGLKGLLGKD